MNWGRVARKAVSGAQAAAGVIGTTKSLISAGQQLYNFGRVAVPMLL